MKNSHNSKSSSDSDDKNDTNLNRSRDKDLNVTSSNKKDNIIFAEMKQYALSYNSTANCVPMKININDCIRKFDTENITFLEMNNIEKRINEDIKRNMLKTPQEKSDNYSNQVISIIANMQKSNSIVELPSLPYGEPLTDDEFINLLKQCVEYASSNLSEKEIEIIKNKFIKDNKASLANLFKRGKALKDVIENAILTILTSNNENDQEDNFNLLNIERSTATPIVEMTFCNDKKYKLNSKEFIDIFSSHVYIKNILKTLHDFLDNVPSESQLKKHIENYFNNYYIYFCEMPQNILALTIHTGNIYLKDNYLWEYYNETNADSQLVIREKIILNVGHELIHSLQREISTKMKNNFFIKSKNNNKKIITQNIEFREKFTEQVQLLDKNESGNMLDYNFFNGFYFEDLYLKEAKLFSEIKRFHSIRKYEKRMKNIFKEEKNISPKSVNKFKKLNKEHVRRCIRSRILGTKIYTKEEFLKKFPDNSDEEDNGEDSGEE